VAEIRPFRGLRYNQKIINDLATVICPPYDVIPSQMQQELYHRSQYNFIRVEHSRELPTDTATVNKYSRAAATLEKWLEQGILEVDKAPAIYLHDHYFTFQGEKYRRRGITCLARLVDWDERIIRPHEGTLTRPKDDRLNLLWALQANTSPIFALYEDEGQRISSILAAQAARQPIINLSQADGEGHTVWAITEAEITAQIASSLARQPFYIADGHHRYESALNYQRERRACSSSKESSYFDFVMMTLVDFSDPGLVILPPHRLVRGLAEPTVNGLVNKLEAFFEIEKLSLKEPNVWQQVDNLLTDTTIEDPDRAMLVVFGLLPEHLVVLRLRDFAAISQMMPHFHSELYKRLDVSILDHVILERLLGLSSNKEEAILGYCHDKQDAVNRVLDQEYQLAFLVSPVKAEDIKAIADVDDRMPRKATYFYPKLPAGLIINRLV